MSKSTLPRGWLRAYAWATTLVHGKYKMTGFDCSVWPHLPTARAHAAFLAVSAQLQFVCTRARSQCCCSISNRIPTNPRALSEQETRRREREGERERAEHTQLSILPSLPWPTETQHSPPISVPDTQPSRTVLLSCSQQPFGLPGGVW